MMPEAGDLKLSFPIGHSGTRVVSKYLATHIETLRDETH